jgi:hypothetical protein
MCDSCDVKWVTSATTSISHLHSPKVVARSSVFHMTRLQGVSPLQRDFSSLKYFRLPHCFILKTPLLHSNTSSLRYGWRVSQARGQPSGSV